MKIMLDDEKGNIEMKIKKLRRKIKE